MKSKGGAVLAIVLILFILVTAVIAIRFAWLTYRDSHTTIDLNSSSGEDAMFSCTVFDGKEV